MNKPVRVGLSREVSLYSVEIHTVDHDAGDSFEIPRELWDRYVRAQTELFRTEDEMLEFQASDP